MLLSYELQRALVMERMREMPSRDIYETKIDDVYGMAERWEKELLPLNSSRSMRSFRSDR